MLLMTEKYLREEYTTGKYKLRLLSLSSKGECFLADMKKNPNTPQKLLLKPLPEQLKLLKREVLPQKSNWLTGVNSAINQPSASKARVESVVQVEARMALYRKLLSKRQELSSKLDCMPYMVASNAALMRIASEKPTSLDAFRCLKIDGFNETKIENFGREFLSVINDGTPAIAGNAGMLSIRDVLLQHPLPGSKMSMTVNATHSLFKTGLNISEIAQRRALNSQTIITHLTKCIKLGYPIKMEELGVTEQYVNIILGTINRINCDLTDTPAIKSNCPSEITYAHIEAVVAYLQVRNHVNGLKIPYEDFEAFEMLSKDEDNQLSNLFDFENLVNKVDDGSDSDATVLLVDLVENEPHSEPPAKKPKSILDSP